MVRGSEDANQLLSGLAARKSRVANNSESPLALGNYDSEEEFLDSFSRHFPKDQYPQDEEQLFLLTEKLCEAMSHTEEMKNVIDAKDHIEQLKNDNRKDARLIEKEIGVSLEDVPDWEMNQAIKRFKELSVPAFVTGAGTFSVGAALLGAMGPTLGAFPLVMGTPLIIGGAVATAKNIFSDSEEKRASKLLKKKILEFKNNISQREAAIIEAKKNIEENKEEFRKKYPDSINLFEALQEDLTSKGGSFPELNPAQRQRPASHLTSRAHLASLPTLNGKS
jgi:hypothetical protein